MRGSGVTSSQLQELTVDDVVAINEQIRDATNETKTMADAAQAVAELLYDVLVLENGEPACALIRVYATVRSGNLPDELRDLVDAGRAGHDPRPHLTLLGTAGSAPAWNDRRASAAHRAIPLDHSSILAEQAPMIAGLLSQLGVDIDAFLELEESRARVLQHQEYGIFHVQRAVASPLIPAQDFVSAYNVHSVIGCGGGLPSGEVFALVLFTRATVDFRAAELFRTVAYGLKAALVPFTFKVF